MLRASQIDHQQSAIGNGVAVYIHIPFCHHRCSYCDFNIYAGMRSAFEPYTNAIAQEIAATANRVGRVAVPTIYFGGGTPSLLPVELIGGMLMAVRTFFDVDDSMEITVEANPNEGRPSSAPLRGRFAGAAGEEYFAQLRSLGVNRVSLGIQSSHAHELHLLRRGHTFDDAVATYHAARRAGFDNVNVDLIYGLPNQSLAEWRVTLQRIIDLQPDHISAYSLQVEEHTAMFNWVRDGRAPAPDEDVVAEMYELTEEMLGEAGFVHYEISNWASKGRPASAPLRGRFAEAGGEECEAERALARLDDQASNSRRTALHVFDARSRHNLVYWKNEPYFGFGCGAHSFYAGQRYSNVRHPREYIRRINADGSAVADAERIDRALEMGETMMLGLRLIGDGVDRQRFADRFGTELDEVYGSIVVRLIEQGLLESSPDRVRLTRRGRLLGNRVFREFLPDESQTRSGGLFASPEAQLE